MTEIKYQDPEIFYFEVAPDDKDEERCGYITRINVHSSVKIGGVSLGRCTNRCLPGMNVCYIHASRNALEYAIKMYYVECEKLRNKNGSLIESLENLVDKLIDWNKLFSKQLSSFADYNSEKHRNEGKMSLCESVLSELRKILNEL